MSKPMPLSDFTRPSPLYRARVSEGLSGTIDSVAERAKPSHRFLRFGWFAAALAAYGGSAATLIVETEGLAVLALPFVLVGPALLRLGAVPGSYWPFRSFPVRADVSPAAFDAALRKLEAQVRVLRIGPVYDGDPAVAPLIAAARARGWVAIDRFVAQSHLLDIAAMRAAGPWPRNSTLRKNRFHEKHLGEHGSLDWRFVTGSDWTPAVFDDLASVETASWIVDRTDGLDAKFMREGHGAFWRAAAADPVIAGMMSAAVLQVAGKPAAFSFDIDAGGLKYAIANSYDPAFAKHSPGKLLYYRNLVRAADDGILKVDWGAGDSGYKATIGADEGPAIRDWLLLRPGVPAWLGRVFGWMWRRSGQ